jgi:hypothetical protein
MNMGEVHKTGVSLTNGNKIARKKFVTLDLNPLLLTLDIQWVRLLTHTSEFTNGLDTLEYDSAFKHDQHEKGKQGIVPVLIQTPQTDAKDLEHKERSNSVFLEQFHESGDGNIESRWERRIRRTIKLVGTT